jgi:hypothetical protein
MIRIIGMEGGRDVLLIRIVDRDVGESGTMNRPGCLIFYSTYFTFLYA